MDQQTLEQRKIDLENYLSLYLSNEILKNDKVLTQFLEERDFNSPIETQFSYLEWVKKMYANVQNTDFAELKEYTEAMMKTSLQEFFKQSDADTDTKHIDEKMTEVRLMGEKVQKIVQFLTDDIKHDTEQQICVDDLEHNFYNAFDQRDMQQLNEKHRNKENLPETLKKFKSELIDLKLRAKQKVDMKAQVLQSFRIIHNLIESAKVAQQVLKNKISERIILKKIKVAKFNKMHEEKNNHKDSSDAKQKLDKIDEKFKLSEKIIENIKDKLYKELTTFIEIQKSNIQDALKSFVYMQKNTLSLFVETADNNNPYQQR